MHHSVRSALGYRPMCVVAEMTEQQCRDIIANSEPSGSAKKTITKKSK